jgi:dipeptidyl aminopeptidase/acylaminoacyl peptidase
MRVTRSIWVQPWIYACLFAPVAAWAASSKESVDFLFTARTFQQAALSPSGKQLAWVQKKQNADRTESRVSFIYLKENTAQARRVSAGAGGAELQEKDLAWSPDGQQLAFLSDAAVAKQLQLYVMSVSGKATARALTHISGQIAHPQWSPDGKTIALLVIEDMHETAGAVEAAARETGEVAEKIYEQRILLVDAQSGEAKLISPPDIYVYELDWSPDSRQLTYIGAPGSGDNNWWVASLFAIDAQTQKVRELYRPERQIAVPRWSPDGKRIAFIQGLMSDAGVTGGDIWMVAAQGGEAQNLTPDRKSSPAWLYWLDSQRLLFTEHESGGTAVATLNPSTRRVQSLWKGDETLKASHEALSLSVSANGRETAVIRSSWQQPPEVWTGPIGSWKPQTSDNAEIKSPISRVDKITWSNDGLNVQGWLAYPSHFDPHRQYPMIVVIHGGPSSQVTPSWPTPASWTAALTMEDYFVFFPNPRGSYGQGEAFTAANRKDFGYGDLRDILSGMDQVLKIAPVDASRIGLTGWSYGGYMTMWTLTQTNRFRAAMAGAGIANWQSYYGQNLIDQWMIPFFGASVYDDPAMYAKSSPITFIKNVRTPTLIVVGERDKECPAPQSYEYWHALKALGVKTQLMVYADEGHRFSNPKNLEDLIGRSAAWFDEHLKQ